MAIWSFIHIHPKLRASARWGRGGQGGPMSALSVTAWGLAFLAWSALLLAQGLQYEPVLQHAGRLVGGSFVLVMSAAFRDWNNDRHA